MLLSTGSLKNVVHMCEEEFIFLKKKNVFTVAVNKRLKSKLPITYTSNLRIVVWTTTL